MKPWIEDIIYQLIILLVIFGIPFIFSLVVKYYMGIK